MLRLCQKLSIPLVLFCLLPSSCSQRPVTESDATKELSGLDGGSRKPEGALAQQAETFDKYVQGKLTPEQSAALKDGCQKAPDGNIFCNAMNRSELLDKRIRARVKVARKFEPVFVAPAEIQITDGKVANWKKLRTTPVKSLLKGLLEKSVDDLKVLKKLAVKEKRCPNNMAVSVAATMEDYLPERITPNEIAGLYEKAADCLKKGDSDREHYLTRAGLLHFKNKQYKVASLYFSRAVRVPNAFAPRAYYWLHRSQKELGDSKGAAVSLNQLLTKYPYAFHTLVAATASNKDPGEKLKEAPTAPPLKRSKRVPALNALIEQAEVLKQAGFDSSAALMADWAIAESWKAESEIRLYLASLGDAQAKISIAADLISKNPTQVSRAALELYFPKAFFDLFEKHSGSLDPFILLSVARQESSLNEKAVSPANAQGLLQIHPDTSAKLTGGTAADLLDPEQNVTLGSRYLSELLGKMSNQIHMALAAYNAGEEKLNDWVRRYTSSDPMLFIDLISYRETRNYVGSVLRNYYWYRRLHGTGGELVTRIIDPSVAKR